MTPPSFVPITATGPFAASKSSNVAHPAAAQSAALTPRFFDDDTRPKIAATTGTVHHPNPYVATANNSASRIP
jgi:hypothetical protein